MSSSCLVSQRESSILILRFLSSDNFLLDIKAYLSFSSLSTERMEKRLSLIFLFLATSLLTPGSLSVARSSKISIGIVSLWTTQDLQAGNFWMTVRQTLMSAESLVAGLSSWGSILCVS